ncbi:MAG: diguanylate cyclase [Gammaproteobacteria bacterium]|nr:diguanylate cyclase [Gammaproteobacteria bacterium]MBT8111667.1 diguanylate cyclase [Gammaproteobacteria bacterium]NND47780.1 diguanylate cyclase [Woeseiaceae bacterium]NNL46365.1 diguanylate cyclase [Woeseiaceae bacterium]
MSTSKFVRVPNAALIRVDRSCEVTPAVAAKARLSFVLLLLTTILFNLPSTAQASSDGPEAQAMHFVQYDRDDGLSQSAVNQIAQDSSGFMWFATESGLNRFDGYEFTIYRRIRSKPDTMPNDFITDIAVDAAGDLWIATDGGGLVHHRSGPYELDVYRNDPANGDSLADDNLRRVVADPRGWIWVGTMRHGLSRLDPASGQIVSYRHDAGNDASLSDDRVYALWLDADGAVWIGTGAGLDRLDPESGEIHRYALDVDAEDRVLAVRRDGRGDLWIGTAQQGLARINETDGELQKFRHDETDSSSLSSDRVEVIYEDSAKRLWVGTNNGLNLVDDERSSFTRYQNDPTDPTSLSDSYVISIFEDQGGVLWFGTKTGGVNKWNSRSWLFGHVRPRSSGSDDNQAPKITSFTRDNDRQLWVGTFGSGILVLGPELQERTQIRKSAAGKGGLSDDVVMSLLTDAEGIIWAGTMHGGLNRIDPASGEVTVYRHEPDDPTSLAANGIMSLYAAHDGTIWVGTFGGGVSRYERETDSFANYPHDPAAPASLSNPNATAITEDADGVLWVATSGGGLNRLSSINGNWESYVHDPEDSGSLSGNAAYSLHVDRAGNLWAGTRSGLNRFLPSSEDVGGRGKFQVVSQSDGLPNEAIYGILSDSQGQLWLSTNYGISRYNPETGDIRSFHLSDGLQGEEFNFGAYFADDEGMLYFGGNNGFNVFDPVRLAFTSTPPKVVLTDISKFNEPAYPNIATEVLTDIDLDYIDDMVSFTFSAVDYTAPSRNRYAYKLEGFDRDWVEAGATRRATYTDLPGGNYVFHVKAANSDGVWGESDVALAVSVQHPPWLRPWAFALYLLAGIGAIYLLYQIHARKLAREADYSKRLETEVRDRTSELAESNSELHDANDRLREASLTDALTGLRNRRYLFEEVLKDVELVRRKLDPRYIESDDTNDLVFIMVDLDKFKPINDNCGHLAGDMVLLQVRDVLQSVCRASDIVIRWGGDEFLIVGRESTHTEASVLVERVRAKIAQTVFSVGNGQVARTTCSIGFASYPFIHDSTELLDWEQVLGVADAAMYRAKIERNAWVGIHGITWDRSSDSLYQMLQSDLDVLVDDGCIRIEQSLSVRQTKTA